MSKDLVQEQFDTWYSKRFWSESFADMKELLFEAWQASREAVVVELPCDRSFSASDDPWFVREQCKGAIEDQGLKVKS